MKRFEFPLESVLRLRRFREQEARQALQAAIADRNAAEAQLAATRSAIRAATVRLSDELADLPPHEIVYAWRDLDLLEATALKQAQILAEWELTVEARRTDFVAAQQERKPLERLKEELREQYRRDADAAEQAMNDEFAVIGHNARKGREP
ncbi:MAG: flagellar export protein FliJ [Fimbriimonadaceae bacterium]|nr:flagellar export protein FliJ [Fimbriimonadaceae bacterium]